MTIPALACRLRVTARCLSVEAGGDIHDALMTPFGLRLLIGDVMGSGLPAHETGCRVVSAWRELAMSEQNLAGIAVRLHALISRSDNPERFVTALLANFGCRAAGKGVEIVCCGHPPPMLLRAGSASFAETFPAPPLGLLDLADGWCSATRLPFEPGDALLLYTDGVTEARDKRGRYFPLSERAAQALRQAPPGEQLLDHLLASLRTHVGQAQTDDILLLLVAR